MMNMTTGLTMRCSSKPKRNQAAVSGARIAVRQLIGIPLALLLGAVTCGVGWLFAGWLVVSPSRQGLWDRIARTTVREVP